MRYLSCLVTKPTYWRVPSENSINLGIRPVWSESSLCPQWVAKDASFLHTDSKDSDQTGRWSLCWFCHEVAQFYAKISKSADQKTVVSSLTNVNVTKFGLEWHPVVVLFYLIFPLSTSWRWLYRTSFASTSENLKKEKKNNLCEVCKK